MPGSRSVVSSLSQVILRRAEAAGAKRAALLSAAGLQPDALADALGRIPLVRHRALLREAIRLSGDAAFALRVGCEQPSESLGLVGHAARHAETLRNVFDLIARYWRLMSDGIRVTVRPDGAGGAWVAVSDPNPTDPAGRGDLELATAGLLGLARIISGTGVVPRQARFAYPKPAYEAVYVQVFACALHFDAEETALAFDRETLELPSDMPSHRLEHIFEAELVEIADSMAEAPEWLLAVRDAVLALLGPERPHLPRVARRLGVSPRTLQRQFQGAELTYSGLVDSVVRDSALWQLRHTHYSVETVALLHGYSTASTFVRAVRRWTGATPLAVRGRSAPAPGAQ
jgi:AraC-like DNA-binding protein